jgi:hypothetical protein
MPHRNRTIRIVTSTATHRSRPIVGGLGRQSVIRQIEVNRALPFGGLRYANPPYHSPVIRLTRV